VLILKRTQSAAASESLKHRCLVVVALSLSSSVPGGDQTLANETGHLAHNHINQETFK
jgi:hypothetical protein